MKSFQQVAVVIPCYNEAAGIAEVIAQFPHDELRRHGLELKIYVVDNNSSDNTAAVAKKAGATVIYEGKKGKGNALRAGFKSLPPEIDYVVMLDGDNTYSAGEIMRVIEPLRSDFCDVVIGSRLGGRIQRAAMNKLNLFGNQLFTLGVRLLYRANVTDVLTGYFAWKKTALDDMVPHITSEGFAVEMEMITKMAKLGHQMASVPISYHPRAGESNLCPFKDGSRILAMLIKNLAWRAPAVMTLAPEPAAQVPSRRKIVFVSDAIYPYMKGGKEKRLHEITKHLADMGHDVHIYTMHWWKDAAKTRTESGVTLHAISRYYPLYKGNRRSISEGIMFGLACFKLLRVKFDILDVDHMPFFPIFSAWIVCAIKGQKLCGTWHESLTRKEWTGYMGLGGLGASVIESLSIRLPHHITAASQHTKKRLETMHGRTKHIELVASGIDTSLLAQVKPADVQCDVLYAGRLVKDKNVDKLVAAIGIIAQVYPEVRCIIIGQGPEKKRLVSDAMRHGLGSNITFMDPLPEASEVYAYMKAAKVFCSPSVREGFGIVSLEALGCGTPVVTIESPTNAARHLIQDGENGSIVPLSLNALAGAIIYWMQFDEKPDTASPIAHHDWYQLAQRQAEVYGL